MIHNHMLYSLRDISIIPSEVSDINSRSECNPYVDSIEGTEKFLPLITAPMTCVLNDENYKEYRDEKINTIIPRTVSLEKRLNLFKSVFCAFSLKEADILLQMEDSGEPVYILLDMANGHMRSQLTMGRKLKEHFKECILMGGNIANPSTYSRYDNAGFNFIRVGIGGGQSCLSSTQTGVHYAMASLISDIYDIKVRHDHKCKIVADGGIGSYSEAIKCLALGADYVMMGKVFTKAALNGQNIGDSVDYYGMSTKRAQSEMGSTKLKTSEGKSVVITKEYTLHGWCENFSDYLKSAMSYCNSKTISEFSKNAECQVISPNTAIKINDK